MAEKLGLEVVTPPAGSLVRLQHRLDRGHHGLRAGVVAGCIAIATAMVFTGKTKKPEVPRASLAEIYLAHRSAAIDPRALHLRDGSAVMLSSSAAATVYLVDVRY